MTATLTPEEVVTTEEIAPEDRPWVRSLGLSNPHGTESGPRLATVYSPMLGIDTPVRMLVTAAPSNGTWVLLFDRYTNSTRWTNGWGLDNDVPDRLRRRYVGRYRGNFLHQEGQNRIWDITDPLPNSIEQADADATYMVMDGGTTAQAEPMEAKVDGRHWVDTKTGAILPSSTIVIGLGTPMPTFETEAEQLVWERDKAQRDLVAFKALVARRLVEETNTRQWCSEAEGWLRSLGLEPPPQRYRVLLQLYVEEGTSADDAVRKIREEFGDRVYEVGRATLSPRS